MKVLYFSVARQATSLESEEISLAATTDVAEIWRVLIERHPNLAALRSSARLSQNEVYATADTLFSNHDVVAVLPPVSGG